MKIKLITFVFAILSFISLQAVQADSNCLGTDLFAPASLECVYCPTTLVWGEEGLTCAPGGSCRVATDNHSHTNWCDYCSKGSTYVKGQGCVSPKQSK